MKATQFFREATEVPNAPPLVLAAQVTQDLRPALRSCGSRGFLDLDDLGECERHVFLLDNGVTYALTIHLQLGTTTLIEVNSTSKPIDGLLSDLFEFLGFSPSEEAVHQMNHEFDAARSRAQRSTEE